MPDGSVVIELRRSIAFLLRKYISLPRQNSTNTHLIRKYRTEPSNPPEGKVLKLLILWQIVMIKMPVEVWMIGKQTM